MAQVAPEPPLDRSGRRAGAKRPDVLMRDIGRPAILLMSPGQARQTIRTHHSVVHRPREGHMLATEQHVEAAEHVCYLPKASPCGFASNDAYACTVNA